MQTHILECPHCECSTQVVYLFLYSQPVYYVLFAMHALFAKHLFMHSGHDDVINESHIVMQSLKLHAAIGYFLCTLLECPTVSAHVDEDRPTVCSLVYMYSMQQTCDSQEMAGSASSKKCVSYETFKEWQRDLTRNVNQCRGWTARQ